MEKLGNCGSFGSSSSVAETIVLQCKPHLTRWGYGVLADPAKIDAEFHKAWLPSFLPFWEKGSLDEFNVEVDVRLPTLDEVSLSLLFLVRLLLSGRLREMKVLQVHWFDGLARY